MELGYIKLHRKLLEWEWYKDIPVRILFEHCLLRANRKNNVWHGKTIEQGSFVTSLDNLAYETGLSKMQIRTALNKLKLTHEITHKTTHQYSIISINNWNVYQQDNTQPNIQITLNKNKENKEKEKINKKEKEILDNFNSFYEVYPLKKSKSNALKAYKKAILAAEPSAIMSGLQRYIEEIKVKKTEKQYIKHPATWLNQKCWEDEYLVSNKETAKIKPYNPYYNAEADNLKVLQGEQKQVKYNPYYNAFAEGNYA